jgi:hypothetical protein
MNIEKLLESALQLNFYRQKKDYFYLKMLLHPN